jgi:branched-subunit amino acid transport protein AzlD
LQFIIDVAVVAFRAIELLFASVKEEQYLRLVQVTLSFMMFTVTFVLQFAYQQIFSFTDPNLVSVTYNSSVHSTISHTLDNTKPVTCENLY